MMPLAITARIVGRISLPGGPLALDGLLAAAVAMRDGLAPAFRPEDVVPIEIPIAREPAGRFHIASFSLGAFERFDAKWINRRFPLAEAQVMAGPKLRRISLSSGPCKSFRIPLEAGHLAGDTLHWYCIGDAAEISALLSLIGYLGKKRSVGLGKVARDGWSVEPCEPWGPGFPVVGADGQALRPLPIDWPGLRSEHEQGYRNLTYPYPVTLNPREQLCAVPRC